MMERRPVVDEASLLLPSTHPRGDESRPIKRRTLALIMAASVVVVAFSAATSSKSGFLRLADFDKAVIPQQHQKQQHEEQPFLVVHSLQDDDEDDPVRDLLDSLDDQLDGRVLWEEDNDAFQDAAEIWNKCTKYPRAVVECHTAKDVQTAVPVLAILDRHHDIPFRIKSGGHSYTGWSGIANGIILSVQNLNSMTLDKETGILTVGPGATVQDCECDMEHSMLFMPPSRFA